MDRARQALFVEATTRSRVVIASITVLLLMGLVHTLIPGTRTDPQRTVATFALMSLGFGIAGLLMAMRIPVTARARTQAILLAFGIFAYSLGELMTMFHGLAVGPIEAAPGLSDLLFGPAMYLPMTVALWSAFVALRKLRPVGRPLLVALCASSAVALGLWFAVFSDVVSEHAVSPLALGASLGYPIADIFLLMLPSIALILVLAELGGMPMARPWWSIASATLVLGITDAIHSHQLIDGAYVRGTWLDMGWIIAFGMIVVGIARLLDLYTAEA